MFINIYKDTCLLQYYTDTCLIDKDTCLFILTKTHVY